MQPLAKKPRSSLTSQTTQGFYDKIQGNLSDISTAKSLLLKELTEIDATIRKCEFEKEAALDRLDYDRMRRNSGRSDNSSLSTGSFRKKNE